MEINECALHIGLLAIEFMILLLIPFLALYYPELKQLKSKLKERCCLSSVPPWVYGSAVTVTVVFVLFVGVQKPITIVECGQKAEKDGTLVSSVNTFGIQETCSNKLVTYFF